MKRAGAGSAWAIGVLFFLGVLAVAPPARAQAEGDDVPVDVPPGDQYADTDPSALTDFRPTLDPHGTWADDPTYGAVWTPNPQEVGSDFQPYVSNGRWDYTDNDYSWVSGYDWGWVVFHYGRWVLAAGVWEWIPGRAYSAAWVDWRVGDAEFGYLGWAPTAPSWIWMGGGAYQLGFAPPQPWAFAPYGSVFSSNVGTHVVTGSGASAVATHTRPYVRAQPTVTPQTPAQPVVHAGPPPSSLGIDMARIPRQPASPAELRARQFARPSTAVALGARAPAAHVVRPAWRAAPARQATPSTNGKSSGGRRR